MGAMSLVSSSPTRAKLEMQNSAFDGVHVILSLHSAGLARSVVATALVAHWGILIGGLQSALYTHILRAKLHWHDREACHLSVLSRLVHRNLNPPYGDLWHRLGLKGINAVVCATLIWIPACAVMINNIEFGIRADRGTRSLVIHRKTRALLVGSAKVIHVITIVTSTTGEHFGICFNRALCSHLHEGIWWRQRCHRLRLLTLTLKVSTVITLLCGWYDHRPQQEDTKCNAKLHHVLIPRTSTPQKTAANFELHRIFEPKIAQAKMAMEIWSTANSLCILNNKPSATPRQI